MEPITIKLLEKLTASLTPTRRFHNHWEVLDNLLYGTRLKGHFIPPPRHLEVKGGLILKSRYEIDHERYQSAYDELEQAGVIYKDGKNFVISAECKKYLIEKSYPQKEDKPEREIRTLSDKEWRRLAEEVETLVVDTLQSSNELEKLENGNKSGNFRSLLKEELHALIYWRIGKTSKADAWAEYKKEWIKYYEGREIQIGHSKMESSLRRTFERHLDKYNKILIEQANNNPEIRKTLFFL